METITNSALTQLARGTGALEAEIDLLKNEASNAATAYDRAIAGKKVALLNEALVQADALLDTLLAIANI